MLGIATRSRCHGPSLVLGWCQTIAAVVLSTVAYMCETVDSFSETFGSGFFVVESLFVAVFTLELLVKISCTPSIPLLFKARVSCFAAWLCVRLWCGCM